VAFRLREFKKADFDTLWRIDQECFDAQMAYSRPEMAFYMRRAKAFTIVAEDVDAGSNGDPEAGRAAGIIGFIVAEARQPAGHIITIDVVAEARRLGVGAALLLAAEARLRQSGSVAVSLETAVNNAPAIRFYKKMGYFVGKTIRGYYSNQLDALVMEKDLGPAPGS